MVMTLNDIGKRTEGKKGGICHSPDTSKNFKTFSCASLRRIRNFDTLPTDKDSNVGVTGRRRSLRWWRGAILAIYFSTLVCAT